MHVLIIGLGVSGTAVKEFCQKRGDRLSLFDDNLAPDRVSLEGVELAVKAPGISFSHPLVKEVQAMEIPLIGEIDLALQELKDKTLYAITGSNGKTTTTLLAAHLLNGCGKKAVAAGNIGTPLISQVGVDADYIVVELSSFQLEAVVPRPIFDAALLLNLTPNHLDRHKTFEAYVRAKFNLRNCLKKGAPFYVSRAVAKQFHLSDPIFDLESISSLSYRNKCVYPHDLENCAAALALTGVDKQLLQRGLETFEKPPHRLEFVLEWKGVTFINDSKATSVDAVTKAVEAIPSDVVLIAGGVDKGGAYSDWLPAFRKKVRGVFAIGEAAARIEEELHPEIVVKQVASFEEGVKKAIAFAKKGETVLLSPGCSSYDQFKNYEQRGERFKEMISALKENVL